MQVVIVGNGISGYTAWTTLAEFRKDVTVSLVSSEPLPLYSPCLLPYYVAGKMAREKIFVNSLSDYRKDGLKTYLGHQVNSIDINRKYVYIDECCFPFDVLILATGSSAIVPHFTDMPPKGVFTVNEIRDIDCILNYAAKTFAVVGSGPIGIEMAVALKERGVDVIIIEALDRILPRLFDAEVSAMLESILKEHGVRVITGDRVINILGRDNVSGILMDKGGRIECDAVIWATGVSPNVALARQAGIRLGPLGGIYVNNYLMTSAPNVYACGDCIESLDLIDQERCLNMRWYDAKLQGMMAGLNAAGARRPYDGSINTTSVNVFGTPAVSIGNTLNREAKGVETIQKSSRGSFSKLYFVNGILKNAQLVGDVSYSGSLLSVALKKWNIARISELMNIRSITAPSLVLFPWFKAREPSRIME